MSTKRVAIARTDAKKILISGAFATGKTVLSRLLVDKLRTSGIRARLLSEIPRRCPYALNKHQTTLASAWLIGEQIRAEVEASIGGIDILVCDRGVPDILSHTTVIRNEEPQVPLSTIIAISKAWCSTYDLVFWVKSHPLLPVEPDDIRVPDKDYQALMEQHIAAAFSLLGLNPILLPQNTEERVKRIFAEVTSLRIRSHDGE